MLVPSGGPEKESVLCPFSWLRLWLKMNLKPSSATLSRLAINWKFRAPCLSCLVQVCVTHENRLRHNQSVQCDGKPGLRGPPESPDELQSCKAPHQPHSPGQDTRPSRPWSVLGPAICVHSCPLSCLVGGTRPTRMRWMNKQINAWTSITSLSLGFFRL